MRILVVEDEKEISDGISAILRGEGYQVDAVYDGLSGLDSILEDIHDLILLDVMLPKLNGIDILRNARMEGIKTPIIILTARSQTEDKIQGLDLGADDYLTKPFDAGELLARIRARTRKPGQDNVSALTFCDIKLDKNSYKLLGKEKSVKLGNKEFQLLECLMTDPGHIHTKDTLISKVWGFCDEGDYNSLEVYISFLRKKLKFVEAETQIITTKGVGYSLEESKTDG